MANEDGWYYFIGGQQYGPVTAAELKLAQLTQTKKIETEKIKTDAENKQHSLFTILCWIAFFICGVGFIVLVLSVIGISVFELGVFAFIFVFGYHFLRGFFCG